MPITEPALVARYSNGAHMASVEDSAGTIYHTQFLNGDDIDSLVAATRQAYHNRDIQLADDPAHQFRELLDAIAHPAFDTTRNSTPELVSRYPITVTTDTAADLITSFLTLTAIDNAKTQVMMLEMKCAADSTARTDLALRDFIDSSERTTPDDYLIDTRPDIDPVIQRVTATLENHPFAGVTIEDVYASCVVPAPISRAAVERKITSTPF